MAFLISAALWERRQVFAFATTHGRTIYIAKELSRGFLQFVFALGLTIRVIGD